jgi:hypothetical protein
MQTKENPHKVLMSKEKGQPVHIRTSQYSYWGRFYEYNGLTVMLKPYYTNQEKDLHLHTNVKELKLDEIIDVD